VFVTFVIIFKFIIIYLLHVLLVFKIKGIFGKKISTKSVLKGVLSVIYSIDSRIKNVQKFTPGYRLFSEFLDH